MKIGKIPSDKEDKPKPLLPLVKDPPRKVSKENSLVLKLHTDPENEDSATYEMTIPYLSGTESIREAMKFLDDFDQACIGQNIKTGDPAFRMAQRLLTGEAKSIFQREMAKLDENYTKETCNACLRKVFEYMCPRKALNRIKFYMRNECRKDKSMTMRQFATLFCDMNANELPKLPPKYSTKQSLRKDEVKEILWLAIPPSWRKHLTIQGFDIHTKTLVSFINRCEQIEHAEAQAKRVQEQAQGREQAQGKEAAAKDKPKWKTKEGKRKMCALHGPGNHTTDECVTIQKLAEAKKTGYNQPNGGGNKQARYGNKTWVRDSGTNNKSTSKKPATNQQEEMKAFVAKTIRKELAALNGKKRKKASEELNAYIEIDDDIDPEEFSRLKVGSSESDDSDGDSTVTEGDSDDDDNNKGTDISV